jgi:hypothetical protein
LLIVDWRLLPTGDPEQLAHQSAIINQQSAINPKLTSQAAQPAFVRLRRFRGSGETAFAWLA